MAVAMAGPDLVGDLAGEREEVPAALAGMAPYLAADLVFGHHIRRYDAPLTSSTAPLAIAAAGEARNTTAAATSSGVATRPRGLSARRASPRAPVSSSAAMSVSVKPGATAVTVIPRGPRSRASDWPKAIIPAFDAPYAGWPGSPRNAPRDDTFTIRPPRPPRSMCCTAHQVTFAAPTRFTPSVSRHPACHSS